MPERVKPGGDSRASLEPFVDRCAAALLAAYAGARMRAADEPSSRIHAEALIDVVAMLAVLTSSEQIPLSRAAAEPIRRASGAIFDAVTDSGSKPLECYLKSTRVAAELSGLDIFDVGKLLAPRAETFSDVARALLCPSPEAPIEPMYFETMPTGWLGRAYQHLLALRPSADGGALETDSARRKRAGVYFTPPYLVKYVIESVLASLLEPLAGTITGDRLVDRLMSIRLLDPAMGGGDFLSAAVDSLSSAAGTVVAEARDDLRKNLAASCVFGVDVDPVATRIARFNVWASSGFADGIGNHINAHLVCADALSPDTERFDWQFAFGDASHPGGNDGFDAVVGNPPYVAAKNGLPGAPSPRNIGQSDLYLMFLSEVIEKRLVKPGGMLSMVLPDPMLVRENAAAIRRKLAEDWTILSLVHISRAFPDANVANIVPVCRNARSSTTEFPASRIEHAADRRSFAQRPVETAAALAGPVRRSVVLSQKRREFLYLLEDGVFGDMVRRIHGEDANLANYEPPYVPLRDLNVKETYRGEEIGKAAITDEQGDLKMLLGGQSIRPYEITWEGRGTVRSKVRKKLERYLSTKILVQKSSAHIIAALDQVSKRHRGYVFPQSVYAIQLRPPGMHELYLLCILNSEVMNEYLWRTVTGYKFLQPQIELEDIRALPIRRVNFTTPENERSALASQGIRIFDRECLRAANSAPFPELGEFVATCIGGGTDKSDVVHDILVTLGRRMTGLTKRARRSPSADTTNRMTVTRAAIETIVWRLYSSRPAQMALPL